MYVFRDVRNQNKNVKTVKLRVGRCQGGVRREENSRRLLHRYSRKIFVDTRLPRAHLYRDKICPAVISFTVKPIAYYTEKSHRISPIHFMETAFRTRLLANSTVRFHKPTVLYVSPQPQTRWLLSKTPLCIECERASGKP